MQQRSILLALAALVPMALLVAGLTFVALRQQQDATRDEALVRATGIMRDVDRELSSYFETLAILAQSPLLDSPEPDLRRFRDLARRVKSELPFFDRIVLSDRSNRQIVNSGVPEGTPLPPVVEIEGHLRVLGTGERVLGDLSGPGPFSRDGLLRASLRVPVTRDGEVRYVLTALLSTERMTTILGQQDLPEEWRPFVVDGIGRVVAAPASPDRIGESAGRGALAARSAGAEGVYRGQTPSGEPVVTAFSQSIFSGWSAHVSVPLAVYNRPLLRASLIIALAIAAALAMTALFALLFRRELKAGREAAGARERAARLEALGRVTGGVAHDVNNVLHVILSGIALIRRRHPDPALERYLSAMKEAAEKGARTTQGLLAFSRGGSGRRAPVDLVAHVRGLEPILRQALRGDIALALDLPKTPLVAEVDTTQLDLALLNLLSNARDAQPDGGRVRVVVTGSEANAGEAARVTIAVRDDGVGIAEEHLARVFEPFFTTKEVGAGTGLGLAQVYGFARSSGGTARVESRPGAGTSVEITLPRTALPVPAPTPAPAANDARAAPASGRLLVVDDNDEVRRSTAEYLADLGYSVSEARSADDALARLRREPQAPEIVVSDLVMPGTMNGLGLAEEIRRRWPGTVIVLVTGYSDAATEAAGRGFSLVPKPVDFDALTEAIRTERRKAA